RPICWRSTPRATGRATRCPSATPTGGWSCSPSGSERASAARTGAGPAGRRRRRRGAGGGRPRRGRATPPRAAPAPAGPPAGRPRAAWRAAQRREWGSLAVSAAEAPADDVTGWELGSIGRRVGILAALRRRDPAAAREMLAKAWPTETPDDRAALLGALATGLSTGDEPLLETALDDRRKEVRVAAVELLALLPD